MYQKIFFFIFLFLLPKDINAEIKYFNNYQFIKMEIFKDDKLIGYNNYFFKRKNNHLEVTNEVNFKVKLFGVEVFNLNGSGVEKYIDKKLISYKSKTKQNKKDKFVNLFYDKEINKFVIHGSSFRGNASTNNIIGNWWNHNLLKTQSQISPISGSIKKQITTFVANEEIELYGKKYRVAHFHLKSNDDSIPEEKRFHFDVWSNLDNSMILKVSYSKMGQWEYRVKNFK